MLYYLASSQSKVILQRHVHLINLLVSAIAVMCTINPDIMKHDVALRSNTLALEDAVVMYLSTTKYSVADTFLNTTLRHTAAKYLSTMKFKTAKLVKK